MLHLQLRLHREVLHLYLEAALVARKLLPQPAGFVERPPGRGRLRLRLRRLDAETAGISNKPVIVMTSPEQPGPPRQHLGCEEEELSRKKEKDKT